jgi:hypothetical protein
MSKFRDTPPPQPGAGARDDKIIPFPSVGGLTPEQREAELSAAEAAVTAELRLRSRYSLLRHKLSLIERDGPVPADWRAALQARDDD